jgi:hypothetical protein
MRWSSCLGWVGLIVLGLTQAGPAPAASPPSATAAASAFILPGEFRRDDDAASLRRRYGASAVQPASLDGAEGETIPGLVLFGDDPARRLEVLLDDEGGHGIAALRARGAGSRWRLDNGVTLGMSLAELAARNGRPVGFSGLGWDYGGAISDWQGGKLAPAEGAAVFRSLTLEPCPGAADDDYPLGDASFRSDDAHYPRLGKALCVGELFVSFAAP